MTSGNDLAFAIPDQTQKRQKLSVDADDSFRWLIRAVWIYHSYATIMCGEGQGISAWRKCTPVDPAGGVVQILATHSIER
jgi:hypothetical protein